MAYVETGGSIASDTVVLREEKGSPLNTGEFDSSLQVIVDALNDLNTRVINIISGSGLNVWSEYSVTLSSGVITCDHSSAYYVVDTENGDATDDLDKVEGLGEGALIILSPANDSRKVVVKHGTYLKLAMGRDFSMDSVRDKITLRYLGSNVCEEVARSSNA